MSDDDAAYMEKGDESRQPLPDTQVYLLGIGDFSRFSRLSVRMLRHYDERGLLVSAHVDAFNGYQFYAPEQLRAAGRIRALQDAGGGREDAPARHNLGHDLLRRRVSRH